MPRGVRAAAGLLRAGHAWGGVASADHPADPVRGRISRVCRIPALGYFPAIPAERLFPQPVNGGNAGTGGVGGLGGPILGGAPAQLVPDGGDADYGVRLRAYLPAAQELVFP